MSTAAGEVSMSYRVEVMDETQATLAISQITCSKLCENSSHTKDCGSDTKDNGKGVTEGD